MGSCSLLGRASGRQLNEVNNSLDDITWIEAEIDGIQYNRTLQDMTNVNVNHTQNTSRATRPQSRRRNGKWTDEQLKYAIEVVDSGVSMKEASRRHNIPYSSVRDWCYGIRRSRKYGPPTVLNPKEEQLLVDYLLAMCDLGYGLTSIALRLKVYEITKDRWTPFRNGIPGKDWMKWWCQRHPELTTQVAQALDNARARGLTAENARTFYDNLEVLYTRHSFSLDQIWNYDEMGVEVGRNGRAHVIAWRGARNVHSIVSDKQEWLSVLVCINAAGASIPSFYIFRGKHFRKNYIQKCEPRATMAMQQKAWMTSYLFSKWISHFIKSIERVGGISPERQHLLILDGYNSHVTLEVVGRAKAVRLDLLTLLSHTSHALQPLDCSIFKPFKTNFQTYRDYWSRQNVTEITCKETLAHWISLALRKALTERNIVSGFRATGIFPLNRGAAAHLMKPSALF